MQALEALTSDLIPHLITLAARHQIFTLHYIGLKVLVFLDYTQLIMRRTVGLTGYIGPLTLVHSSISPIVRSIIIK